MNFKLKPSYIFLLLLAVLLLCSLGMNNSILEGNTNGATGSTDAADTSGTTDATDTSSTGPDDAAGTPPEPASGSDQTKLSPGKHHDKTFLRNHGLEPDINDKILLVASQVGLRV